MCLLFSCIKLGEFVASRVPPYNVGECFRVSFVPVVTAKITKNHIIDAYSDVEFSINGTFPQEYQVDFQTLREGPSPVKCP